jgi:hypothetical protein
MTSPSDRHRHADLRAEIVASLTPVTPLARPSRRVWILIPLGVVAAATTPLVSGIRQDLLGSSMMVTWGLTGLQALLGIWILSLAFREAVPGENLSRRALLAASVLSLAVLAGVTAATNALSPTVIPHGSEFRYWIECVAGPLVVGVPFMLAATLLAVRAFPTRPALTGALCGLSAGILSDAGWRLGCFVSSPGHVVNSHDLAIVMLAAFGSLLAVVADSRRWR